MVHVLRSSILFPFLEACFYESPVRTTGHKASEVQRDFAMRVLRLVNTCIQGKVLSVSLNTC